MCAGLREPTLGFLLLLLPLSGKEARAWAWAWAWGGPQEVKERREAALSS